MTTLGYRNTIVFFLLLLLGGALFGYERYRAERGTASKLPEETVSKPSQFFGTATVIPDSILDGQGENIDSPEFYENGGDTLLLVSDKKNDLIEVWPYPFESALPALERDSLPNGLAVDQDQNLLLIGNSEQLQIEVLSLPELKPLREMGADILRSGETNLDVLTLPDGKKYVYGTESSRIHAFDLETGARIYTFEPSVESIEEVLADSYHQVIYVPDEAGGESENYKGGAVTAYQPNGEPYLKDQTAVFGKGVFSKDGEGITLYPCREEGGNDTGQGYIVVSDQRNNLNDFEIFDRETWQHLGTLQIEDVSFTDGIAATSIPLPAYPKGLFAAVNNDKTTALVSWEKIEKATGLSCEE